MTLHVRLSKLAHCNSYTTNLFCPVQYSYPNPFLLFSIQKWLQLKPLFFLSFSILQIVSTILSVRRRGREDIVNTFFIPSLNLMYLVVCNHIILSSCCVDIDNYGFTEYFHPIRKNAVHINSLQSKFNITL